MKILAVEIAFDQESIIFTTEKRTRRTPMWNHIKAELLKAQERYLCGELDERELDILVNHTFLPVDRRK